MKKRKSEFNFGIIIYFMVIVSGFLLGLEGFVELKTVIIVSFIIVICVYFYIVLKKESDEEKKNEELSKNIMKIIENEYKYYIDIVDEELKNICDDIENETDFVDYISIDKKKEYFNYFVNCINWISENRIVGKPDSFIIASCLLHSIMNKPIIISISDKIKEDVFLINMKLAKNCVLKIISEPSTYFKNDFGIWEEEKHPKVEIVIPSGIIKNSELDTRIMRAIYKDYKQGIKFSIMQFSNLLHLIYLFNCK